MRTSTKWTTESYEKICKYMRGGAVADNETAQVVKALDTYMKHSALLVPSVPRSVYVPRPLVLWRGVRTGPLPAAGTTISSNGGCYTAFSYDRETAESFAEDGFLIRMQVDRIARGTPWIWFLDESTKDLPPRWKNIVGSTHTFEYEVLLPPGYFKVLSVHRSQWWTGVSGEVVDVAYVPRPQYLRRGAVPRLNSRGLVAKTVGGYPLVTNHAEAIKNVQRRIIKTAARAVAPPRMTT